jgi:cobyrinic acid a,c-diamide synthase
VGLPVVGALGRDESLHLPERHLGLIPTAEPGRWQAWLHEASSRIAAAIDLERVLELARTAPPLTPAPHSPTPNPQPPTPNPQPPVIAVARDIAFNFLYEDNLALLREAGAEIAFFSPLHDAALPPGTQGLYLCGGFPELYAADLAANAALRQQIRAAAHAGMPIYAECGGLMYLTEAITDQQGQTHPMAGVLPGASTMTPRLTLGYRTIRARQDSWLWQAGETVRGHEFHYSTWQHDQPTPAYEILPDEWRPEPRPEGVQVGSVLASYVHLHFLAHPALAQRFVAAAARHSQEHKL